MSLCLFVSLLYFLVPPSLACPNDAQIAAQAAQNKAYEEWQRSLDFTFLEKSYANCKIDKSKHVLSAEEQCYVSKLSARCTEADDCLVQCMAGGMNDKVGGGCWHLCFESKFDMSKWSKPKGWVACTQAHKHPLTAAENGVRVPYDDVHRGPAVLKRHSDSVP